MPCTAPFNLWQGWVLTTAAVELGARLQRDDASAIACLGAVR
jgi:hypothetical protein